MSEHIDNIYCINLETSKERKEHMKKEFKKHGMSSTFVRAIHPIHREYTINYKNPRKVDISYHNKRCFCQKPQTCIHEPRKIRPIEVAIALSHYYTYKKILKNRDKWALICEDDIKMIDNFMEVIGNVVSSDMWESDDTIIINLGGARDNYGLNKTEISLFTMDKLENGSYSNYCYILNHNAIKVLIRNFYPIARPEDSYKRYLIGKKKIKCYRIKPSMVAEMSAGRNAHPIYHRLSQYKPPPRSDVVEEEDVKKDNKKKRVYHIFSNKGKNVPKKGLTKKRKKTVGENVSNKGRIERKVK